MISRRHFLAAAGGMLRASSQRCRIAAYRIDAVVVFFSRPIFTRAGVGEGMLMREERTDGGQRQMRFAFAGGSWPHRARNLNRFGYFSECVRLPGESAPEAEYFGFMTRSEEKSLQEAGRALEAAPGSVPVAAIHGRMRDGCHESAMATVQLDPGAGWSVWPSCLGFVAQALRSADASGASSPSEGDESTFLHTISRIVDGGRPQGEVRFLYGRQARRLSWRQGPDRKATEEFAARRVVERGATVLRVDAEVHDVQTKARSRFSLWHDPRPGCPVPLRIELQPRSYLRLRLEAVAADPSPLREELEKSFAVWQGHEPGALRAGI